MDRKEITAWLRKELFPALKAEGFSQRDGLRLWRHHEDRVDICELRFLTADQAYFIGSTQESLSVDLGGFFRFLPRPPWLEIPEKAGLLRPKTYDAHVRGCLVKHLAQANGPDRSDVWHIGLVGDRSDAVLDDLRETCLADMPGWFDRLGDYEDLLDVLHHGEETEVRDGITSFGHFGAKGSPARTLLIAYIARHLGKTHLAREAFERAIEQEGDGPLAVTLRTDVNSLSK
ncbi:hypothetical protein FHY55_05580 [Oceanicola sp. D3]|uniref:hypothetical protein n=1 Tax=Oceanicola sp. D3 TaxID=2587163 RepID=UPI00112427BD|nr:hypothetical protein [Oceanicola sp. D3]QDC08740.1 hypothetical protein FHY55_05580 [Oceanicola sp. D3]